MKLPVQSMEDTEILKFNPSNSFPPFALIVSYP